MFSKLSVLTSAFCLLVASMVVAQGVPRGNAEATVGSSTVSIEYGRPSLNGRDMLGMAPAGTVWRTGADKSTTFTASADISVGGKSIPAGSYSLFTKRIDDKTWHLIFNQQTGQWGTNRDASQDLAEIPLEWNQSESSVEQFTITTDDGELALHWGTHVLSASMK